MCGSLRPESAAMAGVLSRDAPDIEVPTAALGWKGHRGAGGRGHTRDRAWRSAKFSRERLAGQAGHGNPGPGPGHFIGDFKVAVSLCPKS